MSLSRRDFMKAASSTAIVTGLVGCGSDASESVAVTFEHGVASGDPTQTQVIIWTRVTTSASYADVSWQVSSNENFTDIVQSGTFTTDTSRDFTVKSMFKISTQILATTIDSWLEMSLAKSGKLKHYQRVV